MCRDVSVSVTQQNLVGFVWHTSGSKTPTKCMFQIVHPSLSEVGPLPGSLPPIIVNRRHRTPASRFINRMMPSHPESFLV